MIKQLPIAYCLADQGSQALSPEIAALPIKHTTLSPRAQNALIRNAIKTVGELATKTDRELLGIRHFGPKLLAEVRNFLANVPTEMLGGQGTKVGVGGADASTLDPLSPLYTGTAGEPQLPLDVGVQQLLAILDPRQREILHLRYGFDDSQARTLQSVANLLGVSRARIQQIESKALRKLRLPYYQRNLDPARLVLEATLVHENGVISVEQAKAVLAPLTQNLVLADSVLGFLLLLMPQFTYLKELGILGLRQPPFAELLPSVESICATFARCLAEAYAPLPFADLLARCHHDQAAGDLFRALPEPFVRACLNSHPDIGIDADGHYSLNRWANKRLDDMIIVLRQHGAPLHYAKIAACVNQRLPAAQQTSAHNIHAQMGRLAQIFVRVGHGIFGLAEWGLEQDRNVANAAYRVLNTTGHALDLEDLTDRVLETWQVKRGSVRAAIDLDPRFAEVSPGRYWLTAPSPDQTVETAPNDDFSTLFGDVFMRQHSELACDCQRQDHADKLA